jgi:hypothetical protein
LRILLLPISVGRTPIGRVLQHIQGMAGMDGPVAGPHRSRWTQMQRILLFLSP